MQERSVLLEEIANAIKREPEISGEIDVEITGRTVSLSGFVVSLAQKELAESIARQFGPIHLESNITIESPKVVKDSEALTSARRAIEAYPELAHYIGVDRVINGIAYLKGRSDNISKINDVVKTVAEAPGIRDIVSEVKLTTDKPIVDTDLINAARQALRDETSLREEFIDVEARNGVLSLSGTVNNLKQKLLATKIAQRLSGAQRVVCSLDVASKPSSLDKALEIELLKALEIDKINMRNFNVSVLDGIAFLDGTVDSIRQRDRAFAISEAFPGIRMVQNDLIIGFRFEPKAG